MATKRKPDGRFKGRDPKVPVVPVFIRLSQETREKLDQLCQDHDLTITEVIEMALQRHMVKTGQAYNQ